jgi:hypothetical protein
MLLGHAVLPQDRTPARVGGGGFTDVLPTRSTFFLGGNSGVHLVGASCADFSPYWLLWEKSSFFVSLCPSIHDLWINGQWRKFPIQKCGVFCKVKANKRLRGGEPWYVAQASSQFDAEIAEKGHLWIETSLLAGRYTGKLNKLKFKKRHAAKFKGFCTSHLKKASEVPWRRCGSPQNAHILRVCCAFSPPRALSWTLIHSFEIASSKCEGGVAATF